MPAAAVIPAPEGYINVVAVKKLVVEFRRVYCVCSRLGQPGLGWAGLLSVGPRLVRVVYSARIRCHSVTESKLECSRQA